MCEYVFEYVCVRVCVCVGAFVCVCAGVYTHKMRDLYLCVCLSVCMHGYVRVCEYVSALACGCLVYVYVFACMLVC